MFATSRATLIVAPGPVHQLNQTAAKSRRTNVVASALDPAHLISTMNTVATTADADAISPLLALPALGGAIAAVGAAKFAAYSQLEVVRAAMLSRHIKPDGAKVLQLGGTTKDVFYYPPKTIQVSVVGPDINESLWTTAGMNAGVPVNAIKRSVVECLNAQAGSSYDSIVSFNQLGEIADLAAFINQVRRVLKPGGTFIFYQRIQGSPLASLIRLGGPQAVSSDVADTIGTVAEWDFMQWDTASEALDPHAVGVAIKSLSSASSSDDYSADKAVFEQVMTRNNKKKGGKKQQSGGKGFNY